MALPMPLDPPVTIQTGPSATQHHHPVHLVTDTDTKSRKLVQGQAKRQSSWIARHLAHDGT